MMFQDRDFDEKEFLEGAKDAFFMGKNCMQAHLQVLLSCASLLNNG